MHSLLLIEADEKEIPVESLQHIFQSTAGFTDIRHDTPTGTPIEATYTDGEGFTTVRLSRARTAISIRGTSGVALSAAWILSSRLGLPFRMVDTDYSFDVMLRDISSLQELESAIDKARAN